MYTLFCKFVETEKQTSHFEGIHLAPAPIVANSWQFIPDLCIYLIWKCLDQKVDNLFKVDLEMPRSTVFLDLSNSENIQFYMCECENTQIFVSIHFEVIGAGASVNHLKCFAIYSGFICLFNFKNTQCQCQFRVNICWYTLKSSARAPMSIISNVLQFIPNRPPVTLRRLKCI